MSPAAVDALVLCLMVALTLLFGMSLYGVFRRPLPDLNGPAQTDLDDRIAGFKRAVLRSARTAAGERERKEAGTKDIKAAYRRRLVRQESRAVAGVSLFGGVTISLAGVISRLSRLCSGAFPGQPDGVDFCWGRVAGVNRPIFRGDEDPPELGDHVGC